MKEKNLVKKATEAVEEAYLETTGKREDLAAFYNPEASVEATSYIPTKPISSDKGIELDRYEVVLAYNLYPPYRYSQEYFWLEVIAPSKHEASKISFDWYREQELDNFEITGFVREWGPHIIDADTNAGKMRISWNLPVERSFEPGTMIRHPSTGMRVGFIAHKEDSNLILPEEIRKNYRLISKKPAPKADPIVLAPIVDLIDLSK